MSSHRLSVLAILVAVTAAFLVGRESSPSPIAQASAAFAEAGKRAGLKQPGLVVRRSTFTPGQTADRLKEAAAAGGASVVADIDHAAAASKAGLTLRPTRVLLVGNPKAGTPLMQASQTTGIDLPQKFLIYEDERGVVRLAYNRPRYLAQRHRIRGENKVLAMIDANLRKLARAATGS